ncbi:uncharacterized protein [Amphiura filiformis]|uniref:uncharacterized protein n=1 Tax=Amphiura filiformis TaxID=82378 RepID=UPI003B221F41
MASYQQFHADDQTPAVLQPVSSQNIGSPPKNQHYHGYRATAGLVTGSFQIFCACSSMVLAMAIMYLMSNMDDDPDDESDYYELFRDQSLVFSNVSLSFWAGLCFYLITGIIGIQGARKKTKCLVIAYMVMSIITSVIAGFQVIFESVGAVLSEYCYEEHLEFRYVQVCHYVVGLLVCHSLAALIGFVEMVIAIVSAAYCCHGVCCGQSSTSQTPMVLVPVQQFTANP